MIVNPKASDDSDAGGLLGPCRGPLYAEVPVKQSNLTVPVETNRGNYTHFLIYTRSSFAEQSSPAALAIDDLNASVSNVHFDGNLVLSWDPPAELLRVDVYVAYFATGDLGQNRSQIGQDVPVGTDQVVYTKSTLVEQTTPSSLLIQDISNSLRGRRGGGEVTGKLGFLLVAKLVPSLNVRSLTRVNSPSFKYGFQQDPDAFEPEAQVPQQLH
eukprot:s528_g41.t3